MSLPPRPLLSRQQYHVIHDLEDEEGGEEGREMLECQLELALEKGFFVIVVEPVWLGDQTVRWIQVGNFLHKSAVLASLGALVSFPFLSPSVSVFTAVPVGVFGVCCAGFYDVSWQFDPCCKYQVDRHGRDLARIPSHELHSRTPIVLVRKNDQYRKLLHNSLSLVVVAYLGWQLYKYLQS